VRASVYDLEQAAGALQTLERRQRRSWSTEDFGDLARVRGRIPPGELLTKLASCGLVAGSGDMWVRTERGDGVVAALIGEDWAPYCDAVLELEDVSREAIGLIRAGSVQGPIWRCPIARASKEAPTLAAILAWRGDYRDGPALQLPIGILEAASGSFLMAAARETPEWVLEREAVGHRAEAYSMRFEAARIGAGRLLWVSMDVGDRFGYDIEADEVDGRRAIEVKGSRSRETKFIWTATERAAAARLGTRYEIQYWGEIALTRSPGAEYELLVARGYPRIIRDPAAVLESDEWGTECVAWRVEAKQATTTRAQGSRSSP
jgi:hypothetical protein